MTTHLVLAPGFGDTPRHWAHVLEDLGPAVGLEWPGLWGAPPSATPFGDQVQRIVEAVTPETVVVAHSLGARAALAAAATVLPAGLVLVAPALGEVSVFTPDALAAWRASGLRPTTRPHPDGGETTFGIDVAFAEDFLAAPPPPPVHVPTLLVLMSEDDGNHNPAAWAFAGRCPDVEVGRLDGPHRWWEHAVCAGEVRRLVDGFAEGRPG